MIIWIYLNEEWKDVEYKDIVKGKYEVSNFGKVRNKKTGRIIKTQISKTGYEEFYLRSNEYKRFVSMHRLVALHFIPNGDPINKTEVNHKRVELINGKKIKCNYWKNLEWVTREENVQHSIDTGLTYHPVGEDSSVSKYTNEHIKFICERLQEICSVKETYIKLITNYPDLMKSHTPDNIKQRIRKVKDGRSWTHISSKYNLKRG